MENQLETIRSGFSVEGVRLSCDHFEGRFFVQSRWQVFHRTKNIDEALMVFEGLCLEDYPVKARAKQLVDEYRRNQKGGRP